MRLQDAKDIALTVPSGNLWAMRALVLYCEASAKAKMSSSGSLVYGILEFAQSVLTRHPPPPFILPRIGFVIRLTIEEKYFSKFNSIH